MTKFNDLINECIDQANGLLGQRDSYNQAGIEKKDYFDSINNPIKACYQMIWLKNLRLKSLVNGKATNAELIETILDEINYLRFMYAIIKEVSI